jgi:thiol-disulfide isomerase/thioredoxin
MDCPGAVSEGSVMNEIRKRTSATAARLGPLRCALLGLGLIGVAAVLYVIGSAVIQPAGRADLKALAHGEMAKLQIAAGAPPPATPFLDAQGRTVHLAELRAPVVLVNLWATWCAPCVREMPTLARLQAAYPGHLLVIPVSMDKAEDREKARAFIADHPPLAFYQDPRYALAFALSPPAEGFPTTVIYDRAGRERARLSGAADWNGPDARAIVEALLTEK